jgi:aspartate 1-decarboxylase
VSRTEAAGFAENEKVDIYDVTDGARLATYVIPRAGLGGDRRIVKLAREERNG